MISFTKGGVKHIPRMVFPVHVLFCYVIYLENKNFWLWLLNSKLKLWKIFITDIYFTYKCGKWPHRLSFWK